jgi:hypothetical protein
LAVALVLCVGLIHCGGDDVAQGIGGGDDASAPDSHPGSGPDGGAGQPDCGPQNPPPMAPSPEAKQFVENLRALYEIDPAASAASHRLATSLPPRTTKYTLVPPSAASSVKQTCAAITPVFPIDVTGLPGRTTVSLPPTADAPLSLEDFATGLRISARLSGAQAVNGAAWQGYIVYKDALPNGVAVVQIPMPTGTEDLFTIADAQTSSVSYEIDLSDKVSGLRFFADTLEFLDSSGTPRLRVSPPSVLDAKLTRHSATLSLSGCAADTSAVPPWGRPVTPPGSTHCALKVSWNSAEIGAYPALLDPSWTSTASMATARAGHVAGLLSDGTVMVAGGYTGTADAPTPLASAERFKLASDGTGTWTAAAPMKGGPRIHAFGVVRLDRFYVLQGAADGCNNLQTSESFSVGTNEWTLTAASPVNHPRAYDATATVLADDRILVVGGTNSTDCGVKDPWAPQTWVDIYDPQHDTWAPGPDLPGPRAAHAAVATPDDRVLIIGGQSAPDGSNSLGYLKTTVFFDRNKNQWTDGPTLNHGRRFHGAASLNNTSDDVLVFGGPTSESALPDMVTYGTTERWTGGGKFQPVSPGLLTPRQWDYDIGWAPLSDGTVLAVSGKSFSSTGTWNYLRDAEVFTPGTALWSSGGPVSTVVRPFGFTVTDMGGTAGKVLVAGGNTATASWSVTPEADLYTYTGQAPPPGNMGGPGNTGTPPVSAYCGDGIRDPYTEECDLGKNVPLRDVCSNLCTVNDLIGVADVGQPPANLLTRRELGQGRHPVATSASGTFAWVFIEPDAQPVRLGLSTVDPTGKPLDSVVPISTGSSAVLTSNPVVASIPASSKYAVAYTDFGGDGDELGVALRLVDPQSPPTTAPLHANTTTQFSQYDADLIATPTGIVVAWADNSDPATAPDLKFRTFGFDLTPTSGEQDLAHTPAGEGNVALTTFAGGWAAAWRAGQSGNETLQIRTVGVHPDAQWNVGPYTAGPADDVPAIAELDPTHLLVVFSQGIDPLATGVFNGSKLSVALLDTEHPGTVPPVDLPPGASNPSANPLLYQSHPDAVRVADGIYLGWRTAGASGDPNGEDLWLQRLSTTLTTSGLDFSPIVRPLPRVTTDRTGDQRRPAFAAGHVTAGGEVVAAYEDWGGNFGEPGPEVVALEVIPSPVVRPCTSGPLECPSFVCKAGVCLAPSCSDGIQNGSETGLDCGGGCPKGCVAGTACFAATDCDSSVCQGGTCQAASCHDNTRNEGESGIDCGGTSSCGPCSPGGGCTMPSDCTSSVCTGNICQTPTCGDHVKNGSETDVDCGGSCPMQCGTGFGCLVNGDCQSDVCTNHLCQAPSCHDNTKNGTESDVDCGGTTCPPCQNGLHCGVSQDCLSLVCKVGVCQVPTCMDGVKNGTETGVDCGSSCPKCPAGQGCAGANDCSSAVCSGSPPTCQTPSCTDGAKNGTETDVDCGGICPNKCGNGKGCSTAADCTSALCVSNICQTPSCTDGVKNGGESDVDCGGMTSCARCGTGKACTVAGDCVSIVCSGNKCQAPSCTDTVKNGGETDVDCGGATTCSRCATGKACTAASDCQSGVCTGGVCQAPSCTDTVKNGTETDVDCGGSCPKCGNGKGCSIAGDCTSGVCSASHVCLAPTCMDMVKNGTETDVDCGGSTCPKCAIGKNCGASSDCSSNNCASGVCGNPCSTCSSLGDNCGSVSGGDGCGHPLNCGSCTGDQTCGSYGSNVCGLLLDNFPTAANPAPSTNLLQGWTAWDNLKTSVVSNQLNFSYTGSGGFSDYLSAFRASGCEYDLSAYTKMRFQLQASAAGKQVKVYLATGDGTCPASANFAQLYPTGTSTPLTTSTSNTWYEFDISGLTSRKYAMWFELDPQALDTTTKYYLTNIEFGGAGGGGGSCGTCSSLGYNCGSPNDSCGNPLPSCGSCSGAEVCGGFGNNVCGLWMDDFSSSGGTNKMGGQRNSDNLTTSISGGVLTFSWNNSNSFDDYQSTFLSTSCEYDLSAYSTLRFQLKASTASKQVNVYLGGGDGTCPYTATSMYQWQTITTSTSLDWYTFDLTLVSATARKKAMFIELDPQSLDGTTYTLDNIELK